MIDQKAIEEVLTRGVATIYPSKEFLANKLKSAEKLTLYLGIDPTGQSLHLGHSIQLRKLSEFQTLGHKIILLVGDFTATIGDPTGKISARKMLTREEVMANAELYKKQASKWLDFRGENKAKLKYNSKWLAKMSLADYIKLSANITVDQLLARDMFKKRQEEGKPIFLHEFYYPLLQGYDSVAMNVGGELGGSDQIFNMLVGRDLMKIILGKEKFVVGTKLLEDSSGKKMGKTEGNIVALDEDANQMFGKVMSWADGLILSGLELCTRAPMEKIQEIKSKLDGGMNPRDAKLILAEEIVKIYHGAAKSLKARKNFLKTFSEKIVPDNIKEIPVTKGSFLVDTFELIQEAGSKTQLKRLIAEGAISNAETKEKITDPFFKVTSNLTIRIGSRRFLKIIV